MTTRTRRRWALGVVELVVCVLIGSCGSSMKLPRATRSTSLSKSTTSSVRTSSATTSSVTDAATTTTIALKTSDESCSTATWALARRAVTMVFASIVTPSQAHLDDAVQRKVGGILLGTGAVSLLSNSSFASMAGSGDLRALIATDEEGGRVQRISSMIGDIPSPRVMGATMTTSQIRQLAMTRGTAMRKLGITMDFAPVADVSSQPDGGPIGDRSFSNKPAAATADAVAFAQGLSDAGVLPVFKHFPGHGRAEGNSHNGLVTTPPLSSMQSVDLVPYRDGLAKVPGISVMVGHLIVPGLTNGQPASVSRAAITGLLRGQLGFDGLVVTDDLGLMRGILDLYSTGQAAVRAAEAGADLLLVPESDIGVVVQGLLDAVATGQLLESQVTASADRIRRAQAGQHGCG